MSAATGLPEPELQALLEILGEVHHAEDLASFRAGLLDVIPRVIPSVYTSYNEFGADGSPIVAVVEPEPEERFIELWGLLGHENPLVQRYIYAKLGVHERVAAVSAAWASLDAGRGS